MNRHKNNCGSRAGLALADWVTLGAILVVVLVVSLPRLHSLALRQNELDAIQASRLLGGRVFAMESGATLSKLLQEDAELSHQLEDVEVLEQGRVLRRHGYLFDLSSTRAGNKALRAWPWDCGKTGYGAFVITADEGLRGHPNSDSRWSGPGNAPVSQDADPAWRLVD